MEQPDMGPWNGQNTMGFSRVFVSGEKMTFYGGPQGRTTQPQSLSIQRTPEGTMYLDDHGTILTNFDPKNEVIELKDKLDNAHARLVESDQISLKAAKISTENVDLKSKLDEALTGLWWKI